MIEYIRNAALDWVGKMRSSREEAWIALHTNIGAKLKYLLSACTLTEAKCKPIMSPAIRAALPRAGISSCIKTEFRDGPIESMGAGVLSLFNYNGTSRTPMVIDQCNKQTQLGDIMMANNEDIIMEVCLF